MELIIITGMSGAGKSQAIGALEDIGFYCVDNVPPKLLIHIAALSAQSDGKVQRVVAVVDTRSKDMFAEYFSSLEQLKSLRYPYKVLFLDADDGTLVRRYKETRRKHPLLSDTISGVEEAIQEERRMLAKVKSGSDYMIDTSLLSAAKLKERVRGLFLQDSNHSMAVNCLSFGFKYGVPMDADLMFDVRCLPNPYYVPELRHKTGLTDEVEQYVLRFEQAQGLIPHLLNLIDYLIPLYIKEGKSQLVIAIGCTGGKHRSVVFAQLLHQHLQQKGILASVSHRDINRDMPPVIEVQTD